MSGATRPDSGTITLNGTAFASLTPMTAIAQGVSVIYQQFSLVPQLTVADNVFLGAELRTAGRTVRRATQEARASELLARIGIDISPRAMVAGLTTAQRQAIEIAKAVNRNAQLLILDEPTASLSSQERDALLSLVKSLAEQGMCILYITHLLDEVQAIADDVTILRDGRVALSGEAERFSIKDFITAISGDVQQDRPATRKPLDEPILTIRGLAGERLGPVDLEVHRGEILGVFGLLGSGRTELLESVYGIRPAAAGTVELFGSPYHRRTAPRSLAAGMALVPQERMAQSLFPILATDQNVLATAVPKLAWARIVRRFDKESAAYAGVKERLAIRAADPTMPVNALSGGNQQKVAIGRWLIDELDIRLLLLDDPTQGIDVGTRAELYRLLAEMTQERGLSVLLTSGYPEEILQVADRVIVLNRGRIVTEMTREQMTERALLAAAHGVDQS